MTVHGHRRGSESLLGAAAALVLACLPGHLRAQPAIVGVVSKPCPSGAIVVAPGASLRSVVARAVEGAAFCLKNGIHRGQTVQPKSGQRFYGEGKTVLNGSRLLTAFFREGRYWVATRKKQHSQRDGECTEDAPACNRPEGLFIDDRPLSRVLNKDRVQAGQFYLDERNGKLYFVDDPTGHRVETTETAAAFAGAAANVLVSNLTVEKYGNLAEKGAIEARNGTGWTIENCEVRLNSGGGIGVGNGTHVDRCNIHHNGQIGITGVGARVLIENNQIWNNNTRGFNFLWEAGGVKLAESDGPVFRANHVYDNMGPGLWCDINCHNALYEGNVAERNHDAGIFYEISFHAVIRNNTLRYNGISRRRWFWGADIQIAASQDVEVYGNSITVSPGGCGITLIDQSRPREDGSKYKTRGDLVHENQITFEGDPCAGGVSDARPGDENFSIIADGNNRFDGNLYRVPKASNSARFVWGHSTFGWHDFRRMGLELHGRLVRY